jgi:beta-lactamase regulating signal transducer with metallopeptidase domain
MSPDALSTYLINAVWQTPLVAFTALMIARFAGLAPAGRNRVWLTALAAAALLPAVSLDGLLQATPTVVRIAPTTVVESPTAVTAEPLMATPAFALAPSAAWIMVGLAAAFAVLAVVRLALAGVAASRLAATGRPAVLPGDVVRAVERLAASRHRKPPPILATPAVEGPAVVGAWRPVILIPAQFDVSPDDLRAALLHEMAHVLRHDYAVNLACEILTLPLAWHPAVAAIKAGVRRSRELACDAMAAQAMASQKAYARSLLSPRQDARRWRHSYSNRARRRPDRPKRPGGPTDAPDQAPRRRRPPGEDRPRVRPGRGERQPAGLRRPAARDSGIRPDPEGRSRAVPSGRRAAPPSIHPGQRRPAGPGGRCRPPRAAPPPWDRHPQGRRPDRGRSDPPPPQLDRRRRHGDERGYA